MEIMLHPLTDLDHHQAMSLYRESLAFSHIAWYDGSLQSPDGVYSLITGDEGFAHLLSLTGLWGGGKMGPITQFYQKSEFYLSCMHTETH